MIKRVQRECELLSTGHPEVVGSCADREHQRVVRDRLLAVDEHVPGVRVDADDRFHPALDVELVTEDRTHRVGNIARIEPRGRDLVQQRLERVVVAAVDDHDVDRPVREVLHDVEAREASTDHHDTMASAHRSILSGPALPP